MPRKGRAKAIIDTNLFISFLIGRRLKGLKDLIVNDNVELIFSEQHILELRLVTQKPKLQRYFNQEDVEDLIDLVKTIGSIYAISPEPSVCRDPKDNFLLALAEISRSTFIVTGDKDLLDLNAYKKTKTLTINEFETIVANAIKKHKPHHNILP